MEHLHKKKDLVKIGQVVRFEGWDDFRPTDQDVGVEGEVTRILEQWTELDLPNGEGIMQIVSILTFEKEPRYLHVLSYEALKKTG